jgi:ubiquinone/menaquinone biosynthesis C-methylase UbiE
LPFPDSEFDIVYSYGAMHHSPNTQQCVREALRVLKPGGRAKIMVYHHPSLTGAMLWLRYGLLGGKNLRQCVFQHLESPGTKSYTQDEARQLMSEFGEVELRVEFSAGDLLLHQPSAKFRSAFYGLLWKLFPRFMVRRFGRRFGLFLLITAKKP